MVKSSARLRKEAIIEDIKKSVNSYDCFYVIGVEGLNVEKNIDFRRICRKSDVAVKVVKNTFISIVLKELNLGNFAEKNKDNGLLRGISAMLFINESYGTPGRIIKKFKEDSFEKMSFKLAYVAGELYTGDEGLKYLCSIKTLGETLEDIVSAISSCSSKVVNTLLSCGNVVNAIKSKK